MKKRLPVFFGSSRCPACIEQKKDSMDTNTDITTSINLKLQN